MTQYVFKRTEKKYIVTANQYKKLYEHIKKYMTADEYGKYKICNIYFDTEDYSLIRASVEKPLFKEKLRLRSYGVPNENTKVFLEIKRKFKGVVYKRRVSLPYCEMMHYLNRDARFQASGQVFNEIDYFMNFYHPEPKVYLSYDRIAFCGKDNKNLRITFDSNICFRQYDLELVKGDYGSFLLPDDKFIMEVKTDAAMPLWLCQAMNEYMIYPISFSKYGNVYKNIIKNNEVCSNVYKYN